MSAQQVMGLGVGAGLALALAWGSAALPDPQVHLASHPGSTTGFFMDRDRDRTVLDGVGTLHNRSTAPVEVVDLTYPAGSGVEVVDFWATEDPGWRIGAGSLEETPPPPDADRIVPAGRESDLTVAARLTGEVECPERVTPTVILSSGGRARVFADTAGLELLVEGCPGVEAGED